MYPLSETALTLTDVARLWARELPGSPPAIEIGDRLLAAFWRGDLAVASHDDSGAPQSDRRDQLLEIISRGGSHPSLLVLRPGEPVEPEIVDLPDGGAIVDLRHRIAWPPVDGPSRSIARLAAFEALAAASLDDYSADVAPLLAGQTVTRDAFAQFCEEHGYPLPKFWFASSQAPSSAAAERQCRRWFERQVASGEQPSSKAAMQADAQRLFPGLSRNGFVRIWDAQAPDAWRRSGRPRTRSD
jgi:hypothetical protein